MSFSKQLAAYLSARAMPEGLQFSGQQQWLMGFIDSLEKTILQQGGRSQCKWVYDDFHCYYDTSCGNGFTTSQDELPLSETGFKFCAFCGKQIQVEAKDTQ